jgi:hypothetical protein
VYGTERRFGVEIEACTALPAFEVHDSNSRAKFSSNLTKALGWSPSKAGWEIKSDGSIRSPYGDGTGFEYVSPPLAFTEENLKKVRDVVDAIKAVNEAGVNHSCGLHVHLDMTGEPKEKIKRFWDRYGSLEKDFDAMVEPQRRGNAGQYCKSVLRYKNSIKAFYKKFIEVTKREDIPEETYIGDIFFPKVLNNRYLKMNHTPYFNNRKTCEVRHHHGTLDGQEVVNWIKICETAFEASQDVKTEDQENDINFKLPDTVSQAIKDKKSKQPTLVKARLDSPELVVENEFKNLHDAILEDYCPLKDEDKTRIDEAVHKYLSTVRTYYHRDFVTYTECVRSVEQELRALCATIPGSHQYVQRQFRIHL